MHNWSKDDRHGTRGWFRCHGCGHRTHRMTGEPDPNELFGPEHATCEYLIKIKAERALEALKRILHKDNAITPSIIEEIIRKLQ